MLAATSPMRQRDSSNGFSKSYCGWMDTASAVPGGPANTVGKISINIHVDPYSIVFVSVHGSLEEVLSGFDAKGTVLKAPGQACCETGRRRA